MDWSRKWLVDFNAGKTQLVSFDRSKNTGAIDVKMNGSVLEEKSSFKILGLTLSSKLVWGSYIISVAKNASKKRETLICSVKFLFPEVVLYLYKSTALAIRKKIRQQVFAVDICQFEGILMAKI